MYQPLMLGDGLAMGEQGLDVLLDGGANVPLGLLFALPEGELRGSG